MHCERAQVVANAEKRQCFLVIFLIVFLVFNLGDESEKCKKDMVDGENETGENETYDELDSTV